MKNPKILILVALIPLVGLAAWFLKPQLSMATPQKEEVQPQEEAGKVHSPGPLFEVGERIVNLADNGAKRYLKVAVTLEFQLNGFQKLAAKERAEKEKDFQSELSASAPLIQDTAISIFSSKTSNQLSAPEGKEALKTELKDKLNAALDGPKVVNVFFTQFVVQ